MIFELKIYSLYTHIDKFEAFSSSVGELFCIIMDMEYLQNLDVQLLVGGAVAVLAIAVGAAYLFSSKKPKGLTFNSICYIFQIIYVWMWDFNIFDMRLKLFVCI